MSTRYYLSKDTADWVRRAKASSRDLDLTATDRGPRTAPIGPLLVKVASSAAGGGKYNGKVIKPATADIAATGNLASSDLGADGADCLILNLAEQGKSTHDLSTGKVHHGRLVRINTDGKPVVAIYAVEFEDKECV